MKNEAFLSFDFIELVWGVFECCIYVIKACFLHTRSFFHYINHACFISKNSWNQFYEFKLETLHFSIWIGNYSLKNCEGTRKHIFFFLSRFYNYFCRVYYWKVIIFVLTPRSSIIKVLLCTQWGPIYLARCESFNFLRGPHKLSLKTWMTFSIWSDQ